MGIFTTLRKGFSFFLMSMGVSTYPRKGTIDSNKADVPSVPPFKKPE